MKTSTHYSSKGAFLLLFIILSIYLTGCNKTTDLVPAKDEKLYDATFKTTGFNIKSEPMGNGQMQKVASRQSTATVQSEDAVQKYLEKLDYFLYDETDQLLQHRSQLRKVALPPYAYFGETAFTLPIGNYKLIVVGSMGTTVFRDSAQYNTAYLAPSKAMEDIFYKEIQFEVSGTEDVNETINIERIVGSLEVKLTESVNDIWGDRPIVYATTIVKYPFNPNGTHESDVYFLPFISGQVIPWTTQNFVLRGYILPDRSGHFNVDPFIEIRGQRSGNIAYKDFPNDIVISPNKKLIIEGSVTGEHKYQHFTISADSTWADTDSITFDPE
ncbi:FimB/Mfa2 family fimbrial subunit [Olivibacter sp. SA151]|uniref:FimB/Mfa2 family fimbrial subunit n=1 Tax=Olivibacter jilunii TaxID=985016 RepID=UPI003F167DF2